MTAIISSPVSTGQGQSAMHTPLPHIAPVPVHLYPGGQLASDVQRPILSFMSTQMSGVPGTLQ
jgi:hypothetical protein